VSAPVRPEGRVCAWCGDERVLVGCAPESTYKRTRWLLCFGCRTWTVGLTVPRLAVFARTPGTLGVAASRCVRGGTLSEPLPLYMDSP